jgi:hypothetical protein
LPSDPFGDPGSSIVFDSSGRATKMTIVGSAPIVCPTSVRSNSIARSPVFAQVAPRCVLVSFSRHGRSRDQYTENRELILGGE